MKKDYEEITLDEFIKTTTEWGNPKSYFVNYKGFIMTGMVSDREHTLWKDDGGTIVYNWRDKLNKDELIFCIEAFRDGKEVCGICHKIIEKRKAEYYFAGVYCEECFHEHGLDEDMEWAYSHLD